MRAMVARERYVHHRGDADLAVDDDGRVLDGADREDRHLRRVEDGDEVLHAVHAQVRDRERAAVHVLARQLAATRPADEVGARAGDLLHRPSLGISDHGHDEPVGRSDRDADVSRRMAAKLLAVERRVDGAVARERDPDELREEVVDGGLGVPLAGASHELLPQVQRLRHVHRDAELEDRGGPCLGEAPGDRLACCRQGNDLGLRARAERLRRGGPGCRLRPLDVLGDDAPVRARARQRGKVEPSFPRDAPCQRRRLDPSPGGHRHRAAASPFPPGAGAGAAAGSSVAGAGAGVDVSDGSSGAAAASSPAAAPAGSITAIVAPTSTSPSATTIFSSTPSRSTRPPA